MVKLVVVKRNQVVEKDFPYMYDAYHYYVKHYATLGEWVYYWRCCHTLLCDVHREEIMRCVFTHCFKDGCVIEK